MSKVITRKHEIAIARMISTWPEKETVKWDLICQAAESVLEYIPTRQALSKKPVVVQAYQTRKQAERHRYEKFSNLVLPKSMPDAIERIIKLSADIEALNAQLVSMQEIATRFISNANKHGLSKRQLMEPLVKINRKE